MSYLRNVNNIIDLRNLLNEVIDTPGVRPTQVAVVMGDDMYPVEVAVVDDGEGVKSVWLRERKD